MTIATTALTVVCCALLAGGRSFEPEAERLSRVKAAYLFHFLQYTEWPEGTFERRDDPIIVTIVGRDPFEEHLEAIFASRQAQQRPLRLRRLAVPETLPGEEPNVEAWNLFRQQARESHVLFIAATERHRHRTILNAVERRPVLTVSDVPQFAERGGMIGLVIRDDRMAFDINVAELQQSSLTISSKLLRLARIVESRER